MIWISPIPPVSSAKIVKKARPAGSSLELQKVPSDFGAALGAGSHSERVGGGAQRGKTQKGQRGSAQRAARDGCAARPS